MRWFLISLVLFELLQQPAMNIYWQGDSLIVQATPGSVYLVGGARDPMYMGSGTIVMPAYGVDINRTPINRDAIALTNDNGEVVLTLPIPARTWTVILPIVVDP